MDWKSFLKTQSSYNGIKLIEEYFDWIGKEPNLKDISEIPLDYLESSWCSHRTMKEILLLQQEIRKKL